MLAGAVALWATLGSATPALAQALPPDVVELVNGGLVRGTIVENLPGDHVTIQTVTGALMTFPSAEIVRAGPATDPQAAAPVAAPPVVVAPSTAPRAHVTATTDREGYVLHRVISTARVRGSWVAADQTQMVCTLPCEFDIDLGAYSFALSGNGRSTVSFRQVYDIRGDTQLHVDYEDRGGERLIGGLILAGALVVGGGGAAGGAYLGFVALAGGGPRGEGVALLVASGVVLIAGVIVAAVFLGRRDHLDLREGTVRF